MRRSIVAVVCLCMVSTAIASLRARYTVPRLHIYRQEIILAEYAPDSVPAVLDSGWIKDTVVTVDTLINGVDTVVVADTAVRVADSVVASGNVYGEEKMKSDWWEALESGVWDDYDNTTGFDNVADDAFGSVDTPDWVADTQPIVDGMFWIDSIGETWHGGTYITDNVADTSAAMGGYFVMFYGQINLDAAGDYTFVTSGRYEGTRIWIDFDGNGAFANDTTEGNWHTGVDIDSMPAHLKFAGIGNRVPRVWNVAGVTPGKYRFRAHFWMWGTENANSCVAWFRPGMSVATDTAVLIPAAAFGVRRQPGIAIANVKAHLLGSVSVDSNRTSYVCLEETVTVVGELLRAPAGATPTYVWDMGDTVISTTADTLRHVYTTTGRRTPTLYIEYGGAFPTRTVGARRRIEFLGCKPSAEVAGLQLGGAALGADTSIDVCSTTVTIGVSAVAHVRKPGVELTYTWTIDDTTKVTVTTADTTALLEMEFDAAASVKPSVTVTYGSWGTSDPAVSARAVEVLKCAVRARPALAGIREYIGFSGTRLLVRTTRDAPVEVVLYSVNGRTVLNRKINTGGMLVVMDLAKLHLSPGTYVARVVRRGQVVHNDRLMLP